MGLGGALISLLRSRSVYHANRSLTAAADNDLNVKPTKKGRTAMERTTSEFWLNAAAAAARVINIMEEEKGREEGRRAKEIVKKRLNVRSLLSSLFWVPFLPSPSHSRTISICHETFSGAKCDSRVRNSSPLFSPSFPLPTPSRRNCLPSREPFLRSNGRRRRWRRRRRRPLLLRRSGAQNGHTLSRKSVAERASGRDGRKWGPPLINERC